MPRLLISILTTSVFMTLLFVFVIFPLAKNKMINTSLELSKEIVKLTGELEVSQRELILSKEKLSDISKKNDELEMLGKVRILNILEMYKEST